MILPLLLGAVISQAQPFPSFPTMTLSSTTYGILVLGEGQSREWDETFSGLDKKLSGHHPLAFAQGPADSVELQEALNALEGKQVDKIVVVPLMLRSDNPIVEDDRYILGLAAKPHSKMAKVGYGDSTSLTRVQSHTPIVMAPALDAGPNLAAILSERARALSVKPSRESLILVGETSADTSTVKASEAWAGDLARKVQETLRLKVARALFLVDSSAPERSRKSEEALGNAIRAFLRQGRVLVVPLELSPGSLHGRLETLMPHYMVRYDGRAILPDNRIIQWVQKAAADGARQKDMRLPAESSWRKKIFAR